MTLGVSKAVEDGPRAVICALTGNTSASAAAYAARAGISAQAPCSSQQPCQRPILEVPI
jgi:threonine synthase